MATVLKRTKIDSVGLHQTTLSGAIHFRRTDHFVRVSPNCSANLYELSHVEAPFTKLKLRNKCLSLAKPLPQLDLREASIFPCLHKQGDHLLIEFGTK